MKKVLLTAVALLVLAVSLVQAQDQLKVANKNFRTKLPVEQDQAKRTELITEAKSAIDEFTKDVNAIPADKLREALQLKGEIYATVLEEQFKASMTDKTVKQDVSLVVPGFEALKMAFEKSEKKFHKKDALTALANLGGQAANAASGMVGQGKYTEAYPALKAVIQMRDFLKANGNEDLYKEEAAYNQQLFVTAMVGMLAGDKASAIPMMEKLYEAKYNDGRVYAELFNAKVEKDEAAAFKILEEGRAKFPDDESLRIAEINYYLKQGKLNVLVEKLQAAIDKDPGNLSLYNVLGKVYDDLYVQNTKDGNQAEADKNFNSALDYYNQALNKDAKNLQALYNTGALYYNKAVIYNEQVIKLESDYSKEGQKKYEAAVKSRNEWFEKALPFFQRAEALDPNDEGTLIALKEIYARTNRLKESNEIKAKLDGMKKN